MSNSLEGIQKLTFSGAVDADGHILEDAGLWDRYIEAKYKDRAVRVRTDAKGLEYLEVAGRPSKIFNGGRLAGLSAMGTTRDDTFEGKPTYGGMAPFGAMDPKERLKRIDAEGQFHSLPGPQHVDEKRHGVLSAVLCPLRLLE